MLLEVFEEPSPTFLLIFIRQTGIFNTFLNKMKIAENIQRIRERIAAACLSTGRCPEDVKLIAVTKTVDADKITKAILAGSTIVGENRVQEGLKKFQAVSLQAEWHMIGHLQTNKVKHALQFAAVIQSVDSLRLADEIQLQAEKQGRIVDTLVQVNTSGEESKFGFAPAEVPAAVTHIAGLANVRMNGLMTIGIFSNDEKLVRTCFSNLRHLRDEVVAAAPPGLELKELSMGMTNDFELAIAEGATMVRIGRSIFGERN